MASAEICAVLRALVEEVHTTLKELAELCVGLRTCAEVCARWSAPKWRKFKTYCGRHMETPI